MNVSAESSIGCNTSLASLDARNISVFNIVNISSFEVVAFFSNKTEEYTSKSVVIKSGENAYLEVSLGRSKIISSADNHFIINDKKINSDKKNFAFYVFHDIFLLVEKIN